METFEHLGIAIPDILLPTAGIDPHQWAVIACDQFTSQPEYWEQVQQIVGGAPSTLHMILPEVYLQTSEETARIERTHNAMRDYLDRGLLEPHHGMVLVQRTAAGRTRWGLMVCVDLEQYDYRPGAQSLIRATEETVEERLPPRIRIRRGAPLELPHILVLIDDPDRTVIEPLAEMKEKLPPVYDVELMLGSGHLRGYSAASPELQARVTNALGELAREERFRARYGAGPEHQPLLFAMGDGNHSLATAKAIWEQRKAEVGMDHPSRYALVEVQNVHDSGLLFEPIHRVLFGLHSDVKRLLEKEFGDDVSIRPAAGTQEVLRALEHHSGDTHLIGLQDAGGHSLVQFHQPRATLAAGTAQSWLDSALRTGHLGKIDYVHGTDVATRLASQPGNAALFLPPVAKRDLFRTVVFDGVLPRKTFSMGEAKEKRFYFECRRIE